MRPHADNLDGLGAWDDLIDEPMLNIDPAGISPLKVSNQLLMGRWVLKWIMFKDGKQRLGFGLKACPG